MRVSAGLHIAALWLSATAALTAAGAGQAPTPENQPRLARPSTGAVIQQAVPATTTPSAQVPSQPTAVPAPEPLTPVNAPATDVTQLPNSTSTAPISSSSQAATAYRTYSAAKFGLAIEGVDAGLVSRLSGGSPTADVVIERPAAENTVGKHVAGVKYEDITFSTDLSSKPLSDWISATLKSQFVRKNGSVVAADLNYRVVEELQFFNALISAVTFPALDGASREAAAVTVSIGPEYTRPKAGSGGTIGTSSRLQKRWLASNFKFEMTGLDGSRVSHIDPITIAQKSTENPAGELRDYEKAPAGLVIPNVVLTLPEASGQTWAAWLDDFLVKGNNSNDKERNGSIVYLDDTRQTELARLNLFNCGIIRLASKAENAVEGIRRLQAELYCERMELGNKAGT